MGIFRKLFMSDHNTTSAPQFQDTNLPKKVPADWKKEDVTPEHLSKTMKDSKKPEGIPAIPTDIGYQSGKQVGGVKKTGVISNAASNPGVILGMGLTTAALLGMFRSSFIGDKIGAQKMMQYRIMAQFFTVTALVAGVTIFGATFEDEPEKQKQKH